MFPVLCALGRVHKGENRLFKCLLVFDELEPLLSLDHVGVFGQLVLRNAVLELTPVLYSFSGYWGLPKLPFDHQLVNIYFGRQNSLLQRRCLIYCTGFVNRAQIAKQCKALSFNLRDASLWHFLFQRTLKYVFCWSESLSQLYIICSVEAVRTDGGCLHDSTFKLVDLTRLKGEVFLLICLSICSAIQSREFLNIASLWLSRGKLDRLCLWHFFSRFWWNDLFE